MCSKQPSSWQSLLPRMAATLRMSLASATLRAAPSSRASSVFSVLCFRLHCSAYGAMQPGLQSSGPLSMPAWSQPGGRQAGRLWCSACACIPSRSHANDLLMGKVLRSACVCCCMRSCKSPLRELRGPASPLPAGSSLPHPAVPTSGMSSRSASSWVSRAGGATYLLQELTFGVRLSSRAIIC